MAQYNIALQAEPFCAKQYRVGEKSKLQTFVHTFAIHQQIMWKICKYHHLSVTSLHYLVRY